MMPTEQAVDRVGRFLAYALQFAGGVTLGDRPEQNVTYADISTILKALTALQARVGELEKNLESRDTWIVSKGLWSEFVDSLPPAPHSDEAGS